MESPMHVWSPLWCLWLCHFLCCIPTERCTQVSGTTPGGLKAKYKRKGKKNWSNRWRLATQALGGHGWHSFSWTMMSLHTSEDKVWLAVSRGFGLDISMQPNLSSTRPAGGWNTTVGILLFFWCCIHSRKCYIILAVGFSLAFLLYSLVCLQIIINQNGLWVGQMYLGI